MCGDSGPRTQRPTFVDTPTWLRTAGGFFFAPAGTKKPFRTRCIFLRARKCRRPRRSLAGVGIPSGTERRLVTRPTPMPVLKSDSRRGVLQAVGHVLYRFRGHLNVDDLVIPNRVDLELAVHHRDADTARQVLRLHELAVRIFLELL